MSNLLAHDFKRCMLEELSQVERWLTSRTRLASARHLVQVVRVFRGAPVVRTSGGVRVEGTLSGILMEFCNGGELTSYLWDERACRPRAFDESTAQFLFAQLMELLSELFQPQLATGSRRQSLWAPECEELVPGDPPPCPQSPVERGISVGAMSFASLATEASRDFTEGTDTMTLGKQLPLQYFHNDIKTENLVFSGTTLKLIDFQSLTPLRHSTSSWRPQLEHATLEYQHRHPGALAEGMRAHAEGVALWASGVILTRLLAAELRSDWVYRHRGLGPRQALERVLPEDHCLLQQNDLGPRDVLNQIFSAEATPSILDVLNHPWVRSAQKSWQAGRASATVQAALAELRPQGCDPRKDLIAWIPLKDCLMVEGRPAPIQQVKEMIDIAIDLSGGHFRLEEQRPRRRGSSGDGEVTEPFTEWHITLGDSTLEDGETPFGDATGSIRGGCPPTPTSPSSASRIKWQKLRTQLVLDRFCLQLRPKESLCDDEPGGLWWLRLKWLPALVAGKRARLGGLTLGRRRISQGLGLPEGGGFVHLQQLLLEGRREVEQRRERAAELKTPTPGGSLMLPIFGRG